MKIALLTLLASVSVLSAADQPNTQPAAVKPGYTDTYYINDHLATTVATIDARGIINRMETDAFGAPIAKGTHPERYTGKPWDDDMGAYIFPYRNYRPDEARWMTPDPSGFPNGMNSNRYAPQVLNGIDPDGLTAYVWVAVYPFGPGDSLLDALFAVGFNYAFNNITDTIAFDWSVDTVDWCAAYALSDISAQTSGYDYAILIAHGLAITDTITNGVENCTYNNPNSYAVDGISVPEPTVLGASSASITNIVGCGSAAAYEYGNPNNGIIYNGQVENYLTIMTEFAFPSE